MYDINGTRMPNKFGTDITPDGISGFYTGPAVLDSSLGVKIIAVIKTVSPITQVDEKGTNEKMTCAKALAITYTGADTTTVPSCFNNGDGSNDYWLGAMYECYKLGGHLATEAELSTMANNLYAGMNTSANTPIRTWIYGTDNATIGSAKPVPSVLSGLGSSWLNLWSSHDAGTNSGTVYYWKFSTVIERNLVVRSSSGTKAICVAN